MKTQVSCEKEEKEFRDANDDLNLMSSRLLSLVHPESEINRSKEVPEIRMPNGFYDNYIGAKDNITKAQKRYDTALEALLNCRNKYYVGVVQYTSH